AGVDRAHPHSPTAASRPRSAGSWTRSEAVKTSPHFVHFARSRPASTSSPPQLGHGGRRGRAQLVHSHSGYREQPKKIRRFLVRRSTISASHSGHGTPIFRRNGLAFRHSG